VAPPVTLCRGARRDGVELGLVADRRPHLRIELTQRPTLSDPVGRVRLTLLVGTTAPPMRFGVREVVALFAGRLGRAGHVLGRLLLGFF